MDKEIIAFRCIEIEKQKFYHRKNRLLLEDLGIYKIQVSSMVSSVGKKL